MKIKIDGDLWALFRCVHNERQRVQWMIKTGETDEDLEDLEELHSELLSIEQQLEKLMEGR